VTLFDRKFGATFIQEVPLTPGVYEMIDAGGSTLYVGKAKNLRRRLAQYRGATQKKAHRKMRGILRGAATVRLRPCATELEALLLEHQLIHSLRPRLNLAGAYSFLYPCVGVRLHDRDVDLCCTTMPAELPAFQFYGAYRDRRLVRAAFAALTDLLTFVAHREPAARLTDLPRVPFTRLVRLRQLERGWSDRLVEFLRGDSRALLPQLVLSLLDRPAARRRGQETQARLDVLDKFFEQECKALRGALRALGRGDDAGVAQAGRDPLFLEARAGSL